MATSLMPLIAFFVVIALIPLALWLLKRAGVGGAGQPGSVLRAVANLGIGTSQRVTVVEVAVGTQRHWLVLGVTPEQVHTLAAYQAPDQQPSPGAPAHQATVNQLISRWRGAAPGAGQAGDGAGNGSGNGPV